MSMGKISYLYGPRVRVSILEFSPSLTESGHAERADINYIVRRFRQTGNMPAGRQGAYGDVTKLQTPLQERVAFAKETIEKTNAFFSEKEKELKTKQNIKEEEQQSGSGG